MTREEILKAAGERAAYQMEIPEWGGTFYLRPLTGAQSEEIELLAQQARVTGGFMCLRGMRGRIATWVVADAEGNLVFKPSDADALTQNYRDVLDRIFEAVKGHNGLSKEDAADVERAVEKN